ncbi:MAG: glycosyltransferase [Ignavibacteria bacterium]|nr:glycosyltransferase [Ignavibacteria bacterium]
MQEISLTTFSSLIVSDGNPENLFWNVANVVKQSTFKEGRLEILVLFRNNSEKEKIDKIASLFQNKKINFLKIDNFKTILKNTIQNSNFDGINIIFERISLRPDALDLMVTFLRNNSHLDGVYSDFLINFEENVEFEVTDSKFTSNFPSNFALISRTTKILPIILLVKKKIILDFINEIDGISSFNFLNFFNFLKSRRYRIEKIDVILGAKYYSFFDDLGSLSLEGKITDRWTLEKLQHRLATTNIRALSYNELIGLPFHFGNPFNDLVSIVILKREGNKNFEFRKTIDSLSFQNHKNIEILECTEKEEYEVFTRNFFYLISSGYYVLFLNEGDLLFPNSLSTVVEIFKKSNSIVYVYFDYIIRNEQRVIKNLDFSFEKLKKFNFIPFYFIIPKLVFLKGHFLDEIFPLYYSYWEFWLRLGKAKIFGLRHPEPLVETNDVSNYIETKNLLADSERKAQIILKHKDIFNEMQVEWAQSVVSGSNLFDNTKIPLGIIPNNLLLTKVLLKKSEVEKMQIRRKVLFVMYGWNDSGGGTIFPRNVAIELKKRGWDVSVFYASTKYEPTMPMYSIEKHSEEGVILYGLYNRPAPFNDPENPEREISDPRVEQIFFNVLNEVQPDIIHIHNLHGLCLSLPKIAKERYSLPIVFTPHNYFLIDPKLYMINSDLSIWEDTDFFKNSELIRMYPEKRPWYQKRQEFSKQILNEYLDLVLAVSRRQREILTEFSGKGHNIIVVHQANKIVDELWESISLRNEANREVPNVVRFGYFGGVFPTKGVHNLIQATQYFIKYDAEFHIYGFVSSKYAEQLVTLDKKKLVQFHGEYNPIDLIQIASNVDIGIVSSIYEDPAPLVLLELNAMRLPVLGSKIGGIPDFVVDGVNGFLFEHNDIHSLISAIRFCSLNPEIVRKIRGQIKPIHFFKDYVSHIEKIYDSLISRKLKNPKDYELIVTDKLYSMEKVTDVTFIKQMSNATDIRRSLSNMNFDLLDIKVKEETDDYIIYNADIKVNKEVTLSKFFEETSNQETTQGEVQQEVIVEEEILFEAKEQTLSYDEKVFDLDDLKEITYKTATEKQEEKFETNKYFPKIDASEIKSQFQPELNVVWEGSQFVYHSLALINREHCSNLIDTNLVEVTIIPYETEQFQPFGNPKYEKLSKKDIRIKEEPPEWVKKLPYLWVRHQWPPKAEPPKGAKWVIIQPWEYSTLPKRFVDIFLQADELWVPSNFTRQAFINSGIPFNKVQVVPNGIDPALFQPNGKIYQLPTNKKLKFLYVGGTTYRKGFDILLQSYVNTFTSKDDVVLVVKDMGTESFYRGQTAEELIKKVKETPNAPEIIYIKDYLTEETIASLYRACDVFISPFRGEGFSLPTLEAMACGLPVVVTEGGATEDYVLDSFSWKIPSYKISIGNMIDNDPLVGEAFLFEPDADYLSGLLREIYKNPADIVVRGVLASSYARTYWTWKRSTLKLLSRIDALYGKELSKKAKDILIDNIDAQILLGKAEEEFSEGNISEAFKIYKTIEERMDELNLKYRVFLFLRIAITYILNNDFSSANSYLLRIEDLSPNNIDALYLNAKIKFIQNDLVEALELYSELVSRWNSERFYSMVGNSLDQILVEMADIMYEMNDVDNALQLYTNSLKLNEKKVEAYIGSAKCFIKVNDFEEAKRMLEWGLRIEPENQEVKKLLEEV